ncbi:MAG: NAD(P)-dependent oxidoreductase [Candidatus Binataceae bacterium]
MATKVGFIGLGYLGKPMAINLVRAGFDVMAFDVRAEPLRELTAAGAIAGRSPAEIGKHAEIVQVIVFDDAQVAEVVLGGNGALGAMRPAGIVVLHSTIRPKTIRTIAAAAAHKSVGVIDAPLGGIPLNAEQRTLPFLIGGDRELVSRCRPLFATSGAGIFHLGPLGSGLIAKLAHQVMLALNIAGAAEAMALGIKAGLDPRALQAAIHTTRAQSRVADNWFDFHPGEHGLRVFQKDLTIALEAAHELELSMPAAAVVREMLHRIMAEELK